jgi:Lon protease-like protein
MARKDAAVLDQAARIVEDADEVEENDREENGVDTGLQVDWAQQDDGSYLLTFGGQARVAIEEVEGQDGVIYRSTAFTKPQDELKDALGLAVTNLAKRTLAAEWKKRNPTEKKSVERTSQAAKNAQEIADLRDALSAQAAQSAQILALLQQQMAG